MDGRTVDTLYIKDIRLTPEEEEAKEREEREREREERKKSDD